MSPIVTLSNGYEVSYPCYTATCGALEILCQYHPEAAIALVEKCLNIIHERYPQSKSILQVYHLIDDKEQVDPDIQAIAKTMISLDYNQDLKLVPTLKNIESHVMYPPRRLVDY